MIRAAERWYGRIFVATSMLLIVAALMGHRLGTAPALVTLLGEWVFLGLPHGALDPMVARKAFAGRPVYITPAFYAIYLTIVVGYWWLWNRYPTLGLSLFLLIAAFHFGSDWESRGSLVTRCAYGCAIVTLPAFRFPAEVASIYFLLGTGHGMALVIVSKLLAPISVAVAALGAALHLRHRGSDALELLTIVAGSLVLEPLVFFITYFALLHSPRHLLETAEGLGMTSLKRVYSVTLPTVFATLLLGALAYAVLPHMDMSARILRIVFIGLAALTVPHMLLETLAHAQHQRQMGHGSMS